MWRWFLLNTRASVRSDSTSYMRLIRVLLHGIYRGYTAQNLLIVIWCGWGNNHKLLQPEGRWQQKQINQPKAGQVFIQNFDFGFVKILVGKLLKLPAALQMEKATINLGLVKVNLSVRTFILLEPWTYRARVQCTSRTPSRRPCRYHRLLQGQLFFSHVHNPLNLTTSSRRVHFRFGQVTLYLMMQP